MKNYGESRWEPSELNGGKLCEAAYTTIRGIADGAFKSQAEKPKNMVLACLQMESETAQTRSVRFQIPRMIVALYEVRNNRGVGHAGSEVDPNQMDATVVLYIAKWIVAELVRLIHTTSTEQATELVESLTSRELPLVWQGNSKKRVLDSKASYKNKTLLLLATSSGAVSEAELVGWIEAPNLSDYRSNVLRPMHKAKLIEFDEHSHTVQLLPPGSQMADALAVKLAGLNV